MRCPSGVANVTPQSMQRILAIGGGGFLMEDAASPVDRLILELTGKSNPRVCYIGTPSGDMPDGIEKFYAAFPADCCVPSHLAFFRKPSPGGISLGEYKDHLLQQDAVFVGGGNTKSALGVWREWGVPEVLLQAYRSGMLLSGMSAGAMCWFESGLTDSFWGVGYRPLQCLGFLGGACAVHYNSDPQRRARLHGAIEAGVLPAAIAIDDFSAVLYENGEVARVFRWSTGAGAFAVSIQSGKAVEVQYESAAL